MPEEVLRRRLDRNQCKVEGGVRNVVRYCFGYWRRSPRHAGNDEGRQWSTQWCSRVRDPSDKLSLNEKQIEWLERASLRYIHRQTDKGLNKAVSCIDEKAAEEKAAKRRQRRDCGIGGEQGRLCAVDGSWWRYDANNSGHRAGLTKTRICV